MRDDLPAPRIWLIWQGWVKGASLRALDSLGDLVGVEAERLLQLLDLLDVALLGLLGADSLVDDLFPGLVLVLGLCEGRMLVRVHLVVPMLLCTLDMHSVGLG